MTGRQQETLAHSVPTREEQLAQYERLLERVDTWAHSSYDDVKLLGAVAFLLFGEKTASWVFGESSGGAAPRLLAWFLALLAIIAFLAFRDLAKQSIAWDSLLQAEVLEDALWPSTAARDTPMSAGGRFMSLARGTGARLRIPFGVPTVAMHTLLAALIVLVPTYLLYARVETGADWVVYLGVSLALLVAWAVVVILSARALLGTERFQVALRRTRRPELGGERGAAAS